MICPPCAEWADTDHGDLDQLGHPPEICRDFAIQPGGCACQHQPKRREEARDG